MKFIYIKKNTFLTLRIKKMLEKIFFLLLLVVSIKTDTLKSDIDLLKSMDMNSLTITGKKKLDSSFELSNSKNNFIKFSLKEKEDTF